MLTYFLRGGPVMWPILMCSIAAGTISIIIWFRLWQANHLKFPMNELKYAIYRKNWSGALQISRQYEHPFLNPLRTGFYLLVEGKSDLHDIEEAVSVEGAKTIAHFESALNTLGALIMVLPMLGFLGTILGLIISFENWEQMGAQVSISVLAGGIYQAMITTAAGLIAAIPYHLLHHYFINQTHHQALKLSQITTDLFRSVKEALIREDQVNPDSIVTSTSS